MRRPLISAVAVLTAILVVPASAAGQAAARQTSSLRFTTQNPSTSAGSASVVNYTNPANPSAKPFAVDRLRLVFHPGTVIDTFVPTRCGATNAQLSSQGVAACPAGSSVGGGVVRLDTGFSGSTRFLTTDVTLINNTRQLIFVFRDRGSGRRFVTRAPVGVRAIDAPIPVLPGGAPDGQTAIDRSNLTTRAISNLRGRYLTTPGTCPAGGAWINRAFFTYNQLVQQAPSRSACRS